MCIYIIYLNTKYLHAPSSEFLQELNLETSPHKFSLSFLVKLSPQHSIPISTNELIFRSWLSPGIEVLLTNQFKLSQVFRMHYLFPSNSTNMQYHMILSLVYGRRVQKTAILTLLDELQIHTTFDKLRAAIIVLPTVSVP